MALNLTVASTDLPLSLAEVKEELRISDDADDAALKRKLRAAARWCERQVRGHRKFVKATYNLVLPEFPSNCARIELSMPPLVSVGTITYYDNDNASQTLSSTVYDTMTPDEQPGYIVPKQSETWESTYDRPDAVTIPFTCGYGVPRKVPEDAKEAILVMTEAAYDPTRLPMDEAKDIARVWLEGMEYGAYG
jgi:uncharacterized phiE125 gp8 family phage protein